MKDSRTYRKYDTEMKGRLNSVELSGVAIFSSILTIAEVMSFALTWPLLPPIVVVPFITSFILAISIPFTRSQWIIGLIAFLITNISKGGILPGPFIIPAYGFIFQTGRVKLSGVLSSIIHVFYGVFLAPLIFSVAPAKLVYDWLLLSFGSFAPAILVATTVFGIGGAIAAGSGQAIGSGIAKNLPRRRHYDP